MEFFHKLFPNRKKFDQRSEKINCAESGLLDCASNWENVPQASSRRKTFELQQGGIRVLLYRECDRRGRKLLYDSRTVVRVPVSDGSPSHGKTLFRSSFGSTSSSFSSQTSSLSGKASSGSKIDSLCSEVCDGYGYQYLKKASDTKQIGEMVFGTVALAYRGPSSKLHLLNDPSRLMLSSTYLAPRSHHLKQSSDLGIAEDSFTSSIGSIGDLIHRSLENSGKCYPSWPVDMPTVLSSCNSEDDSGFGGPPSPFSSASSSLLSPPSLPNTPFGTPSSRNGSGSSLKNSGSLNSLQRRYLHNKSTSLEALINKSVDAESVDQHGSASYTHKHNTKLGLAITIDFSEGHTDTEEAVKSWFFSKQEIIESAISKLKFCLDSAYLHSNTFVSTTHKAITQFQHDILDLVCAHKLANPMWLNIVSTSNTQEQDEMCGALVTCLTHVISLHDTKETNFFFSKLLTGVLTYHLGWVATVSPTESTNLKTKGSAYHSTMPVSVTGVQEVDELNKHTPYSALWAQLCELRGAVGYPLRTARTIVVGTDAELLQCLLTVLSYVIRCSQVLEHEIKPHNEDINVEDQHKDSDFNNPSSTCASIARVSSAPSTLTSSSSSQTSITTMVDPDQLGRRQRRSCDSTSIYLPTVQDSQDKRHKPTRDEQEPSSRWMLNDDVEIVIGSECKSTQSNSQRNLLNDRNTPVIDITSVISINSNVKPNKLTSSKTTSNLLDLNDVDSDLDFPQDMYPRLYPDLGELDDHKETFGPISLEPSVIASKVQRLCRVPSVIKNIEKSDLVTDFVESKDEIQYNSYSNQSNENFRTKEKNICATNENKSLHDYQGVTVPGVDIQAEIEDGETVLVLDNISNRHKIKTVDFVHSTTPRRTSVCDNSLSYYDHTSCNNSIISKPNEISSFNKHLPLVSSNMKHFTKDTSKSVYKATCTTRSYSPSPSTRTFTINSRRAQSDSPKTFDRSQMYNGPIIQECSGPMQYNASTNDIIQNNITCIPQPNINLRRVVHQRYVGRESNLDLTSLEKREIMYPTISDLKNETLQPINRMLSVCTRTHKRNNSDPITGSSSQINISFDKKVLNKLQEEDVPKTSDNKIINKTKENCNSEMRDAKRTFSTQNDAALFEVINMPVCTAEIDPCINKNNDLAETLMGGVLDHYSSVFVLHATTDTSQWEDKLKQDLFVDAHFPVLDPSISEAVAIVADINSWDVEVVSSHSYIVEHRDTTGTGRGRGQQVGMSPLIASITDSLLHLAKLGAPPHFILQSFEDRLRELYVKSHLLSEYLLSGASLAFNSNVTSMKSGISPFNLSELTRTLSLDLNDLPLLIAVASTHTPALTHMFGISVR